MLILTLIVLSHFMEEARLLQTISTHLEMVLPSYASTLTAQVRVFLEHRQVIGIVGVLVMLFFSSLAFTVLENAMAVIFFHRGRIQRRHFLISAVIPYIYILLLGLGMLLVSFIAGALDTFENRQLIIFGWSLSLEGASKIALYILGIIGEVLMLTSVYLVMPVGRIQPSRACWGNKRNNFVGGHTSCAGLVLLDLVPGKLDLWFPCCYRGNSFQHRSRGDYSFVLCPGYR
jgi:uncharacterized BrkB/YihY/UPF0761 family membrane protein